MSILKKPLLLTISSGLLLTLAWPTYGFVPFLFLALVPLLYMEHSISLDSGKKKKLRVWAYSYLAFLIWNLGTTWWIVYATVGGMVFANLVNSLFYSLLFLGYHGSKQRLPKRSAQLFFICLWISFEKFHLSWDFSWPWLNLGNAFSETPLWIQWYEITGTFGGTLWVLLVNFGIFNLLRHPSLWENKTMLVRKCVPILLGLSLPIAISVFLYTQFKTKPETVDVLLTQPGFDPYESRYEMTNLDYATALKTLTQEHLTDSLDYILTPETYFSSQNGEDLSEFYNAPLQRELQEFLKPFRNVQLITGIEFYDIIRQKERPSLTANRIADGVWVDFYNSALGMQFGRGNQLYHKSKLVVGVENVPFKKILNPIMQSIMLDFGGAVASRVTQAERGVIKHAILKTKAAPIICYESIYGEYVTDYVKNGANFLAVISNDAWWKNTEGHRQLLSYARLRAIETRRDVARSANTGISAVINARGEILQSLPYEEKGVIKGRIASYDTLTFYTRYGDFIARLAIFIAGLLFFVAISGRLKNA